MAQPARPDVNRPRHRRGDPEHLHRKVEKMNGQNYNVEFSTFEAVRDWRAAAK